MESRLKETAAKQLALAEQLYGPDTNYTRLKDCYELFHKVNMCTKHTTHDSTFFIIDAGFSGFKVIKFYDGGVDYRNIGSFESLAEAYSMAICAL